jgi:hypothetical protein
LFRTSQTSSEELSFSSVLVQCRVSAETIDADLSVCTDDHLDHMDRGALTVLAKNPQTQFAGPIECMKDFEKHCDLPEAGEKLGIGSMKVPSFMQTTAVSRSMQSAWSWNSVTRR